MKRIVTILTVIALVLSFSTPALAAGRYEAAAGGACSPGAGMTQEALIQLLKEAIGKRNGAGIRQYLEGCLKNTVQCPPTTPPATEPGAPAPDAPAPDEPASPDDTLAAYAEEVVRLVNEERARAGLGALTTGKSLNAAANTRAQEIKTKFSHTRPDGTSCFSVLGAHGVSYRGAGENIAMGQKSAALVMEGWMNSAGHRANILNARFTQLGVGCAADAAGRLYWTQLFIY